MDHRLRLRTLLLERSLHTGEFTLAGGGRSTYYVDARPTTMSAEGQFLVGRLAFDAIRERIPEALWVGGLTLGADPIAYAVAHRSWLEGTPIAGFTVRKQAKEHGIGRRIEGGLPDGASAVVVEDCLTTGGSALEAASAVEAHGARVLGVLALVDREAGGSERVREQGYPLLSLFTGSELLDAAGSAPKG